MYPRTEYEMSEADLKNILKACEPTPVMFLSGGQSIGGSQQENANKAWARLGKKMGFDSMTVMPIKGKPMRFFTAVPLETESARKEREKKEAEDRKTKRVLELRLEIAAREKELTELTNQ